MTADERHLLNARIAEILHYALVNTRDFSHDRDRQDEINDLADLLHNLPRYIVGHDEDALDSFEQFRGAVLKHVTRFYPKIEPSEHHYVRLLDMDAEEFLRHYRDHQWGAPESVTSPQ